MRLLLDTHAIMWFLNGDTNLSDVARKAIESSSTSNSVSMASLWEMAIKVSIGKLKLAEPLEEVIGRIGRRGFRLLNVSESHVLLVSKLDLHHRDPFDRLIVAQALSDDFMIVSNEIVFDKYGVKRIW